MNLQAMKNLKMYHDPDPLIFVSFAKHVDTVWLSESVENSFK